LRKEERRSIEAFLETYNGMHSTDYVISEIPDKLNRVTADVDALASCDGHPQLAIEHTTIQTYVGQRGATERFATHIVPLETVLSGIFPFCFDIIVPDEALTPGTDWLSVAEAIEQEFRARGGTMDPGSEDFTVGDNGATVTIRKRESDLHVVYVMRRAPAGDLQDLIAQDMLRALGHKHESLGSYRENGATTVLLLQSLDIALVNQDILGVSVSDALASQPRPNIDQVWLAWHLGDDTEVFCLAGPGDLPDRSRDYAYQQLKRRLA